MPSSPKDISCASWLVYATRATDESARRVKTLILNIKTDRVHQSTRLPIVQMVIENIAGRLGEDGRAVLGGHPMLVPVPGSGLTKPNTVWPAKRVCEELVRQGLGEDIVTAVRRTTSVTKSAGSTVRPTLEQHVRSLSVQAGLNPPSRLLLVDDVVTSGTTMMACAIRLAQAFPGVPVAGFALARVQSTGDPAHVFEPLVERIAAGGQRCTRG